MLITVADPLRAGNELTYYPGETTARMADVLLINKVNSASKDEVERVKANLARINPTARILLAESTVSVERGSSLRGKKVLLVEDGPTITHGGMMFGAASVAARENGVGGVVAAKGYAVGTIKSTFEKYPRLNEELPAMGYSPKQIKDLEATINNADCDAVVSATPTDLRRLVNVNKPIFNVSYELKPVGSEFDAVIKKFAQKVKKSR